MNKLCKSLLVAGVAGLLVAAPAAANAATGSGSFGDSQVSATIADSAAVTVTSSTSYTADSPLLFAGTAAPGSTVSVYVPDLHLSRTTTANAAGAWSTTIAPMSHKAGTFGTIIQATAPDGSTSTVRPSITVAEADASLVLTSDPVYSTESLVTLSGTAPAGSEVWVLFADPGVYATTKADAQGHWTLTPGKLYTGSYTARIGADTLDGKKLEITQVFTEQKTGPVAPPVVDPVTDPATGPGAGSYTFAVTSDRTYYEDSALVISGTAQPGAKISVGSFGGSNLLGQAITRADGTWSIDLVGTHPINGASTLLVNVKNGDGTTAQKAQSVVFTSGNKPVIGG